MWDNNVYYNAENFGLEVLADFDLRGEDWEFDILLVVREKETGKLFVATDSGCSCPTPFEDHKFPEDFSEVTAWSDVRQIVDNYYGVRSNFPTASLRATVVNSLRARK